ncbi:MAG: hypothetical protein ACTSWX_05245, partial [Promethearchaeota archaeon]
MILSQIGEFLAVESANVSISEYLERNFKTIKEKEKAARTVLDFILYFASFRDIIPLREIIYQTLLESLNRAKNLEELHDLLLVDILLRIIEIYIINSPLSDKKTIISTLAKSLLGLAPSALILNLCTIVKPIFTQNPFTIVDKDQKTAKIESTSISKNAAKLNEIKMKIEKWIKSLNLKSKDLNRIEDLKKKIRHQVSKYAKELNLSENTEDFNQLLKESQDILNITLTAISLASDNKNVDLYSQLFPP